MGKRWWFSVAGAYAVGWILLTALLVMAGVEWWVAPAAWHSVVVGMLLLEVVRSAVARLNRSAATSGETARMMRALERWRRDQG